MGKKELSKCQFHSFIDSFPGNLIHSTNIYGRFQCIKLVSAGDIVIYRMVMSFPGLLTFSLSTRELESWDSGGRPGAHLCEHYPATS